MHACLLVEQVVALEECIQIHRLRLGTVGQRDIDQRVATNSLITILSVKSSLLSVAIIEGQCIRPESRHPAHGNVSNKKDRYLHDHWEPRKRKALPTTLADDKLIAAAAITGVSTNPKNG